MKASMITAQPHTAREWLRYLQDLCSLPSTAIRVILRLLCRTSVHDQVMLSMCKPAGSVALQMRRKHCLALYRLSWSTNVLIDPTDSFGRETPICASTGSTGRSAQRSNTLERWRSKLCGCEQLFIAVAQLSCNLGSMRIGAQANTYYKSANDTLVKTHYLST